MVQFPGHTLKSNLPFGLIGFLSIIVALCFSFGVKAQIKSDSTVEAEYSYRLKSNRILNLMEDDSLSEIRKYHFGPKIYTFIPFQKRLIKDFTNAEVKIFFGFFPEYPQSTFKPGLNLYYLTESRERFEDSTIKPFRNRFFVLGPNFGYRYYIPTKRAVQFYFEGDLEYLVGKLRVRQHNINTGWRSCEGVYLLAGMVLDQRIRFTVTRDFLTGIEGYRFNGITFTSSFLFHSHTHKAI